MTGGLTLADFLLDTAARHQHFLERFKTGQANKFEKFLRKADKQVRELLTKTGTIENRRRLVRVQAQVRSLLLSTYAEWGDELQLDLLDFAETQAAFEVKTIEKTVEGVVLAVPSPERIKAAALARPFQNKQVKKLLSDFTNAEARRIEGVLRQGFFEQRSMGEIVRDIRGTRAARFTDGAFRQTDVAARRIARTSVQHFASVARSEVYAVNADIIKGYEWVSTLDSRTSTICAGLDGREFKVGAGPLPPAHPNCRSTTIPVVRDEFKVAPIGERPAVGADGPGTVPGGRTYGPWLRKQTAAFQDEALGKTKGALFRRGGLSIDRFTDRTNAPLNLAELERLNPVAWERAGL